MFPSCFFWLLTERIHEDNLFKLVCQWFCWHSRLPCKLHILLIIYARSVGDFWVDTDTVTVYFVTNCSWLILRSVAFQVGVQETWLFCVFWRLAFYFSPLLSVTVIILLVQDTDMLRSSTGTYWLWGMVWRSDQDVVPHTRAFFWNTQFIVNLNHLISGFWGSLSVKASHFSSWWCIKCNLNSTCIL